MTTSELRDNLASAIAISHKHPVTVTKHGRSQAVLVDPEVFERLMDAAEDLEDIRAFDEAMAEGSEAIPWEQVKADLGWA